MKHKNIDEIKKFESLPKIIKLLKIQVKQLLQIEWKD